MTDFVIDNVIRSQIVEDYLDFFENKNIEGISDILSVDCTLTDWNVGTISGKETIMTFLTEIFDSVGDIEVNVSHIHEDMDGILICEMVLSLDKKEFLVADIFEFNQEDQIKALRAYKGN